MTKSFRRGGGFDQVGILNILSPTHTPPPLSRPAGRKRGASCGRVFEGGKSELDCALTSKGPQLRHEAPRSIPSQHQRALKCLQQFEKPLNQFDGNAPLRTFFPPFKTRPHVTVGSLSAPAGVERVGVRGGIQRIKNKNASHNRVSRSISIDHDDQESSPTPERKIHAPSRTAAKGAS